MLKIANMTNATYTKRQPKLQMIIRIFFARFISQNLIALDTMKSTRRYGLLGIIGRMGSMVLRAAHIVTYVLHDMHI
jgi:hypothetical protein